MKKKLLSLLMLMLAFVGVANADNVTDLTNLSNTKAYYLHSSRGYYTVNSNVESGTVLTSTYFTYWNWYADDASADSGSKFAIMEVDDDLYLFNISESKFVYPDKTLNTYPPTYTDTNKMNFMATESTDYPWVLAYGTQQFNMATNSNGVAYWNDLTDAGNMIAIEETGDEFDPTEALARFEVQKGKVTFNLTYNGNVVATETFTDVVGTEVTFDKSYAFTTISGNTTATIGTEEQTIELTATVTCLSTEDAPVYYYVKSGDGTSYLKDNGDGDAFAWKSAKTNLKTYKFAFFGNPFEGVTVKSKNGNYFYSSDVLCPETNTWYGEDIANTYVKASSTNSTTFTLTDSGTSGVENGFGLRKTESWWGQYVYAGNYTSTNLSYSSYWNSSAAPSVTNQVLLIEEAELEDLSTITWTVSIAGADNVTIGGETYANGASFEGSADLAAADVTTTAVEGYTANVNVNAGAGTISVVYIKDATAFTPSIPEGKLMKVGSAAATMTPATAADDNDHWYIVTQVRGGESAMYDNGTSTMKRASTDVTAASLYGTDPTENEKYLVRFEQVCDGAYRMQFANGNFIQTSLKTGDYSTAGTYKFYNINGTDGNFGWNLTTDYTSYGSIVDNNAAGNTLSFWGSGEVTYTGGNNDWYIYNVEFVDPTTANMTITTAQYATFCAPFDVTIPSDVKAYTVDAADATTGVLTLTEVATTIPANTPVVLNSETTVDQTFSGIAEPTLDGIATAGLLTGVYEDKSAPVDSYVLQSQSGKVGFYQVSSSKQPTVKANRAYLTYTAPGVKSLSFPTEATAIKAIEALTSGTTKIYDANGRRINSLQKGINIVNGTKVLVK